MNQRIKDVAAKMKEQAETDKRTIEELKQVVKTAN